MDARDHLHQRALTRAVLAHHGVDTAFGDVERDFLECLNAGKTL
jgi:hypothetical protein